MSMHQDNYRALLKEKLFNKLLRYNLIIVSSMNTVLEMMEFSGLA